MAHDYSMGSTQVAHPWSLALSVLAPGGLHVMLMELRKPLAAGKNFPLTLTFEKAGKIELEIVVIENPPSDHGGHGSN